MALHELAGKPAPQELLIDVAALERDYYSLGPDPAEPTQRVSFGTSGHRGTASRQTFNEAHILAITQAICDYRASVGISGPLMMGKDTHALSDAAQRTALEVLAANNVETIIQDDDGFTPTPVISHAILNHNRDSSGPSADGIIITPSHNPPADGGFKYNPPHGGPADSDITTWIEQRANELLAADNKHVKRMAVEQALGANCVYTHDFVRPYVADLAQIVDLHAIRDAQLKLAVDPLGGAGVGYWTPIAEAYGLDLTIVNEAVDPRFAFMTLDHDGKIRMDCSSPYAMASLVNLRNDYDLAFGNDPDADRHGIVTRSAGLLNPNHYLAAAIRYLFTHRDSWSASCAIGKTLVSSSIIDRVGKRLGRAVNEVPVGFKWFAPGLFDGSLGFGGEESAGASFLRFDGSVWSTDKDGLIMNLLAAEMLARTGKDPADHYREITQSEGTPVYRRVDAPASSAQKKILKQLTPDAIDARELAGDPIQQILTRAPGNDAAIGGLKVTTANGWFAARPSGTEDIFKIYAESFIDDSHLTRIIEEAQGVVSKALG